MKRESFSSRQACRNREKVTGLSVWGRLVPEPQLTVVLELARLVEEARLMPYTKCDHGPAHRKVPRSK
jgi:hypothetical protein